MPESTSRPTQSVPKKHFAGRTKYWLKEKFLQPNGVLGLALVLLFAYLIVVPILLLLNDSVRVQYADIDRADQPFGALTTYYFARVFTSAVAQQSFWHPLLHTAVISLGAVVSSLIIGGVLAWLLSRTNMFGKKWFSTALIVPYMVPSWTFAMAWMTLFKNRTSGGTRGWLESLGISPPDWLAYGQFPIIAVLSIHYMPFVILLFGNALKRFDSQLEESARVLGASRATITRKIVLPMMLPSLFSAITLIFAKCLGDFGVAYILGLPVKYEVLATSLYRAVVSRSPGVAAVLAGVVILLGLISVLIELRMVREANKFVTVGGKSTMDRVSTLGRKQILATGFASFIFLLTVVIPLGVLILTTIMKVPGRFVPSNFTLDYWIGRDLPTVAVPNGILLTPEFWSATWNSIWMVGLAAVVAGILGQLVGYVVVRGPKVLGTPLRFITFLPYLVPGIAFAAAFLSAFAVARGPIPALYGTGILLVIALTADQMPFASRAGISSMMQLGKDPEEAAQIAGAGWMKRLAKIVFPIQRQALVSGILMPFISGLKGLSLVVLLAVPGTDLLTTYSIRLVDYGMVQASNAVVLMICLIALVGTLVGQRVGKTSLSSGM